MSSTALAQRDLGTITGTITDPSGAAVPNAKITIKNDATGVSYDTVANDTGSSPALRLNPGTYTVTAGSRRISENTTGQCYRHSRRTLAVDFTLKVGNASETVEVTAAAPLLQTESPVIGSNLYQAQVSELPLGGQRTFTFLGALNTRRGSRRKRRT